MKKMEDDEVRHRKRSTKKPPKKSNHKHEYELIKKEEWLINDWFKYIYVCKVCEKEKTEFRIEKS